MDIATATSADFQPHVGTTFRSTLPDGTDRELELIECDDLPSAPGSTLGFALLFRHASQDAVNQQIHELRHDDLGELALFLVPVRQDDGGTYYEAVFSRVPGDATP